MITNWTNEQITALAPDPASLRAGQKLAGASAWSLTGHDDRAVWGSCQGSGRTPYRALVDREGPAYKCSCPSRKIPCKHVLGLLLRWTGSPASVPAGARPPDVDQWLDGRDDRATKAAAAPRPARPVDP